VAQRITVRAMQTTFGFSERRACGLVGVDLEPAHTLIISDDGAVLQTSFHSRNQICTEQSFIARGVTELCPVDERMVSSTQPRCRADASRRGPCGPSRTFDTSCYALRAEATPMRRRLGAVEFVVLSCCSHSGRQLVLRQPVRVRRHCAGLGVSVRCPLLSRGVA